MATITNIDPYIKAKAEVRLQGRLFDGEINMVEYVRLWNEMHCDDDMGCEYVVYNTDYKDRN